MRIISGELKGKSINFLKNLNTRPLKSNVRESIFNVLRHSNAVKVKVENSNILDLYSGIGSFGIECISRGAKKVTFIEKDNLAIGMLEKNLKKLSIINEAKIFNGEIEDILAKNINDKFQIFFFDPPFADKKFLNNIKLIKKNKMFKTNHIVVIHRERKTIDNIEDVLKIVVIKQYGRSKIIFATFK